MKNKKALIILLLLIVVSCNNAENDDDDDDNDDSIDDDDGGPIPTDDDAFDSINENWEWEIVDDRADDFALALNDDNQPVILYSKWEDLDSYELIFALKNGDMWQKQLIANGLHEWVSPGIDVCVSNDNQYHLLFLSPSIEAVYSGELIFVELIDNDWNYHTLSTAASNWSYPTIITYELNSDYVFSFEEESGFLVSRHRQDSEWEKSIIAEEINQRRKIIADYDEDNHIHLVYAQYSEHENDMITYALKEDGEYINQISFFNASNPSMDVDSTGHMHIIYLDNNEKLIYATNESGEFVTDELTDEYCDGSESLCIDVNDNVHIIHSGYRYDSAVETYYLYKIGGVWTSEKLVNGYKDILEMAIDHENVLHALMNINGSLVHLTREIEAE